MNEESIKNVGGSFFVLAVVIVFVFAVFLDLILVELVILAELVMLFSGVSLPELFEVFSHFIVSQLCDNVLQLI